MRSKLIVTLATLGLMAGGTGGVIAAGNGNGKGKGPETPPGKSQYKPGFGPCKSGGANGSGQHAGPPGQPGSNCQTDPPPPGK